MVEGEPHIGDGLFMGCVACGHCAMVCPGGSIEVTGRGFAPDDVVELPPGEMCATQDQLEALLLARRSVRRFTDREVPREMVERIIRMASTGPTSLPPNETGIVVFDGRDKVHRFAEGCIPLFRKAARMFNPLVLSLMRPFIGKTSHAMMRDFVRPLLELTVRKWEEGEDVFCYNAPLAMIFHRGPTASPTDSHIVATYAMLAAQSLGLASCWIGTVDALNHDQRQKAKYAIPKENQIMDMLVIGFADVKFKRSVRRRLASVNFV
jgi:nitroreductase